MVHDSCVRSRIYGVSVTGMKFLTICTRAPLPAKKDIELSQTDIYCVYKCNIRRYSVFDGAQYWLHRLHGQVCKRFRSPLIPDLTRPLDYVTSKYTTIHTTFHIVHMQLLKDKTFTYVGRRKD